MAHAFPSESACERCRHSIGPATTSSLLDTDAARTMASAVALDDGISERTHACPVRSAARLGHGASISDDGSRWRFVGSKFGSSSNGPATKRVKKEDEIKMKAEMKDGMKKEVKQEVKVEKKVAVKIVIGDGADEWQEVGKKPVPVIEIDDDDWDEDATDAHLESYLENSVPRPLPKLTPAHKCGEKKVYLYSLGWKGLGMQYMKNIESALPSLWRQFEFNFKSKRCPDVFVDCRAFHWPRGPKGHTGLHRVAIQQVSDNPLFFTWLQKFHATVTTWDFQRPLTAAMICKAGINRSVSGTVILAAILDYAGYTVVVEHLAEASWRLRGICPGTCSYCSDSSLARTEAYKYGSYCWDTMQH